MERFDPHSRCPKCGSESAATYEYHHANIAGRMCGTNEEHMHRICPECGANWAEAPLDAGADGVDTRTLFVL